ncbi:hypothetical protein PG997_014097 [Apiospora hydei]|uniref:Berberine/berberine-like domain-containing protein n=1 Tax=Apiospora hydei TaxID=1337664 RepID=A0ABR1V822_9PEZI
MTNYTSLFWQGVKIIHGHTTSWAQRRDWQRLLTDIQDEALLRARLDGCAYVNEADQYQEGCQERFWGAATYAELLGVKKRWYPTGVFYAVSMPGTEGWLVIGYGMKLWAAESGSSR